MKTRPFCCSWCSRRSGWPSRWGREDLWSLERGCLRLGRHGLRKGQKIGSLLSQVV